MCGKVGIGFDMVGVLVGGRGRRGLVREGGRGRRRCRQDGQEDVVVVVVLGVLLEDVMNKGQQCECGKVGSQQEKE